jgi:hypothetical protein
VTKNLDQEERRRAICTILLLSGALRGVFPKDPRDAPKEVARILLDWFAPSVALKLFDFFSELVVGLTSEEGRAFRYNLEF